MTGPLCALVSSSSKRRASILVVRLVCVDPGPGLPAALGTSQVLDKYYLGWESAPPICSPQKCSSWWPAIEDMDLDQLDLNPRIIAAVKKARLKAVKEVLHFSGADLQRLTGLSSPDVQHLLTAASSHLRGGPILTALHLYQQRERFPAQHQRLSLGCPILDGLLGGGLPLEGITELAGCSSAGKTQLALQLCLAVQFPPQHGGLEAGVRHPVILAPSVQRFFLPLSPLASLIKGLFTSARRMPSPAAGCSSSCSSSSACGQTCHRTWSRASASAARSSWSTRPTRTPCWSV
ncbi:DNA repair protein XRCC3 isoform X5 [Marmota flaviventris]|uniref:DNA repair protein XRCC3 isoform X5 n=1 Tax=Marmota flaviventris TaxID=93162 RepID=UPI003A88EF21